MGAHRKFPEFRFITPDELEDLLKRSNLTYEEREIARQVITWNRSYADIGECLTDARGKDISYSRSTIGYKMRKIIAPRLLELIESRG